MIPPIPHIARLSAYALADLGDASAQPLISLAQNESMRLPSPEARRAAAEALGDAHLYPDPEWTQLRRALAERHPLSGGDILCGAGSMELISCLAQCYAGPQNAVLAPAHAYPFFRTAAQIAQARYDTAPERDAVADVDALLEAVRPDTRLVFLANPGNPTGTRISSAEIRRLRAELRGDILLVVDEAYGEFADHLDAPLFDMPSRGDTVILRSFSKAYGLAGMRVGWGLFPPQIAAEMRKVMNPNNISAAGQAAAAAALADHRYMQQTCAQTAALRDIFAERLRRAGCDVPQSHTNFVLIRLARPEICAEAETALRQSGIIARPQGGVGLGHCLRVSVGATDDMALAAQVLEQWREGAP